MKNKTKGSLFGLLAKNYLLFTLALFLIAGGIYMVWNAQLNRLYQPMDWNKLMADPALVSGNYAKLTRYLHNDNVKFAVLDGSGVVLYCSDRKLDLQMTAGELTCISEYDGATFLDASQYVNENGEYYLIVSMYTNEGSAAYTETGRMVLDEAHRVVSGGLGDGRTQYTDREYKLLAGAAFPGYELYRHSFTSQDGSPKNLLMLNESLNEEGFYRRYNALWRIWLLFIPLYLIAAGLFIRWLNRRIRIPLDKLNEAVVAQTEGRIVRVSDCGGASEIQRIGESFDLLSERLEKSEAERKALDEGRQKLIADISHDLKTPVTVIAGYAGAICDGKIPPEKTLQYLNVIRQKSEALTELINAFHEYSKVKHPEFTLSPVPTDICEFSRAYLAKKYDEIDLAGFTLDVAIPDAPILCALDERQFRRVLDNLISNSVRYNGVGTVLYFEITRNAATAVMKIGDNGSGIPAERRDTIFEPFVVGNDARNSGGSGLGLAITKQIVEKHGGTIRLTPAQATGRGSEFVITLPLGGHGGPPI